VADALVVTPEADLLAMVAMPPAVASIIMTIATVIMAHTVVVVAHALVLLRRRRAWRSSARVIGLGLGDGCAGQRETNRHKHDLVHRNLLNGA
jgi:hypothetical protein